MLTLRHVDPTTVSIENSSFWGNLPSDVVGSDPAIEASDYNHLGTSWWYDGGSHDITGEPHLTNVTGSDPLNWDFSLASFSPLIDAGDPTCIEGDGTVCDIGALGGYP